MSGTRIQRWAEERKLAVVMPSGDNSFYFRSRTPWNDYENMGGYGAVQNGIVFSDTFSHVVGLSSALHLFDDLSEKANIGLLDNLTFPVADEPS